MEVLAWKRAPSFPFRDDDIGASITAQEASNVEGYSSRASGRAFWDSWRSSTHKIPRTSMGADAATTITDVDNTAQQLGEEGTEMEEGMVVVLEDEDNHKSVEDNDER